MIQWLHGKEGQTMRLVVNYGNNTVRVWVGTLINFDEYGIVLEVERDKECAFPWYTCTEISVQ